jgi:hypothetical protein
MTDQQITPVPNPAAQVHYWIAEGIRAHTNMTQAEAASSTQALLDQYNAQPQR